MRKQAEAQTEAKNVVYREGFSHQTSLPDDCAQIVTCSQSLHWMEPQSTFEEAARILIPGGVFAAYDYDWPPTTGSWEADAAYEECMTKIREVANGYTDPNPIRMWEKPQHLSRMHSSGCFRYTRETVIHHIEPGNAERLIGLIFSRGSVMTLRKGGLSESQISIDILKQKVLEALGMEFKPWYWSSRVRIGIA